MKQSIYICNIVLTSLPNSFVSSEAVTRKLKEKEKTPYIVEKHATYTKGSYLQTQCYVIQTT